MAVTLTDEEFEEVWGIFEKLMSPFASTSELQDSIRGENRVWQILQDVRGRADGDEPRPSSEEPPTSSEPTPQSASQ